MSAPDLKEIIDRIRTVSDIVDVIGSYVPLKRAGARYKANSPFNQEKTPSFFVDPAKQFFKCFSSGHGGDVFTFVMLYENLDFMGAVRRLGERAGIEVPERGGFTVSPAQKSEREQLYALHEAITTWWASLLHQDPQAEPARAYLAARDFPLSLAKEFSLGFAPESWDATLLWAKKKGFAENLLLTAGLIKARDSSQGCYDFFRGRLMIPIRNEIGKVVAFSGRLLAPDAKAAKYVNSPETPIFSKSRLLFGLDKNKKTLLDRGQAILCEGQIDLMRLFAAGFTYAVAPQGTALTEHHATLLKRFAGEVIVCFDSDRAGQKAAVRSVEILLTAGLEIRIASLPPGEDPDSLLRTSGAAAMQSLLENAPPYPRYLLDLVCRENDVTSPRGRAEACRQMAEMVSKMPSLTQRQVVGLEIATQLRIPHSLFVQELANIGPSPRPLASTDLHTAGRDQETQSIFLIHPIVATLISLLMHHPELVPQVQRHLHPEWLAQLDGGALLTQLLEAHTHDLWETSAEFLGSLPGPERNSLAELLLLAPPVPDSVSLEEFAIERVHKLRRLWLGHRVSFLEQEVKSGLLTPVQLLQKTKELLDLRRSET
jgi:DNA primase